jgi:hypothetical protein
VGAVGAVGAAEGEEGEEGEAMEHRPGGCCPGEAAGHRAERRGDGGGAIWGSGGGGEGADGGGEGCRLVVVATVEVDERDEVGGVDRRVD